jgi:hypothetical protein
VRERETHRADPLLSLMKAALHRKTDWTFKHESQKDRVRFLGAYNKRGF